MTTGRTDRVDLVRSMLFREWDPIGVAVMGGSEDEYDSYVPQIIAMLEADASADAIADRLSHLADQQMGLRPNREQSARVAAMLVEAWQASRATFRH